MEAMTRCNISEKSKQIDYATVYYLCAGLTIDEIKNPVEVFFELLNRKWQQHYQPERELRMISSLDSSFITLPRLLALKQARDGWTPFRCKCSSFSVDQQRDLYLACWRPQNRSPISTISQEGRFRIEKWLPVGETQLNLFGKLTRRKVIKKFGFAFRRCRRQRQLNKLPTSSSISLKDNGSSCSSIKPMDEESAELYKLESLIEEANACLSYVLERESRFLANRLIEEIQSASNYEMLSEENREQREEEPLGQAVNVMIKAPVSDVIPHWIEKLQLRRHQPTSGSQDSGFDGEGCSKQEVYGPRSDSNANDKRRYPLRQSIKFPVIQLENLFSFRSSESIQSIVCYSIDLFDKLISELPLLRRLESMDSYLCTSGREKVDQMHVDSMKILSSLKELRLYACVECQKLRASIRFHWLDQCLLFAFNGPGEGQGRASYLWTMIQDEDMNSSHAPGREEKSDPTREHLPPIEGSIGYEEEIGVGNGKEVKYLELLATLMSQLLRGHFLEPALERLCGILESHQCTLFDMSSGSQTIGSNQLSGSISCSGYSSSTRDDTSSCNGSKIYVPIELKEEKISKEGLKEVHHGDVIIGCSRADLQLKETFAFIVDQLYSICLNLPRLETQLESTKRHRIRPIVGSGQQQQQQHPSDVEMHEAEMSIDHLVVLQRDDDLIIRAKKRLDDCISKSRPSMINDLKVDHSDKREEKIKAILVHRRSRQVSGIDGSEMSWLNDDYRMAIELINLFRCSSDEDIGEFLSELDDNSNGDDDDGSTGSRFLQLVRLNASQIKLLDWLNFKLQCRMTRYIDFGLFIRFDYRPLNDSLRYYIDKEKSLLLKLIVDGYLKFLEAAQLQFDEIEVGIDLESSIEDYLNEKFETKRNQQLNFEEKILLMAADDNENVDDEIHQQEYNELMNEQQQVSGSDSPIGLDVEADPSDSAGQEVEDFVEMVTKNLNANAFAMASNAHEQLINLEGKQRDIGNFKRERDLAKVAPLIECQLLVDKYQFMDKLLASSLEPFTKELAESIEVLTFIVEYVQLDYLGPEFNTLFSQLIDRASVFTETLKLAKRRLNLARDRLMQLNRLRLRVLSQLIVEFNQLMNVLNQRRLYPEQETIGSADRLKDTISPDSSSYSSIMGEEVQTIDVSEGHGRKVIDIRLLDKIQESCELAQKLKTRYSFLKIQNKLLEKEYNLLKEAKLTQSEENDSFDLVYVDEMRDTFEERNELIECWRLCVSFQSLFWKLVEDFETQQVKWFNSEMKKLDYLALIKLFKQYRTRLVLLQDDIGNMCSKDARFNIHDISMKNLEQLQTKFDHFERKILPIFKFITNRHLNETHWNEFMSLTMDLRDNDKGAYTTLAQLLELHIDDFVDEIKELDRRAIMEHELMQFLLSEIDQMKGSNTHQRQLRLLDVSKYLENWSDSDLKIAATKLIEHKLIKEVTTNFPFANSVCNHLASCLVEIHSLVKRYIKLSCNLNLNTNILWAKKTADITNLCHKAKSTNKLIIWHTNVILSSPASMRVALFVEYLRVFTYKWTQSQRVLSDEFKKVKESIVLLEKHLDDIRSLVIQVKSLETNDFKLANSEIDQLLIQIEREIIRLELERETSSTKEALAIERQKEALVKRDECIRQIVDKAIPSLRAATKALDCLDAKAFRAIRSLRPKPPEPVRLVIEAVCILRSCSKLGGKFALNEHLDYNQALKTDYNNYWPVATRMLNGIHSAKFLADLKTIDKRLIPPEVMKLIRRKYLSRAKFQLNSIAIVSPECAILAKWLIAVDVFDRVISVVKPKYKQYNESESKLSSLLAEVEDQRRQIDLIESDLRLLEDSFRTKLLYKMTLSNLIEECKLKLDGVERMRSELELKHELCSKDLMKLERKQRRLASGCIREATRMIYIDQMPLEDRQPLRKILSRSYFSDIDQLF